MKNIKGITIISLVVTIIVLIVLAGVSINLLIGENGVITKAKESKLKQEIAEVKEKLGLDILEAQMGAMERNEKLEQNQLEDIISNYGELQEDKDTIILKNKKGTISLLDVYNGTTTTTGSYTENKAKIELLENQVKLLQKQLEDASKSSSEANKELLDLKETLAQVTASEDKILKDYTAYKDGKLITGTMANNGAVTKSLNAGESYTIAAGYHNGNGTITANSLASQTQATATADNITEGKTAWVNGELITGNLNISSGNISIIAAQTTYKASNGYSTITLSKDVSEGGNYYAFWTGASGGGAVYPASITITGGTYKALASYTSTTSSTNKNISANVLYEINITDSGNIYFYSSTGWNAAMCCIIFKIV